MKHPNPDFDYIPAPFGYSIRARFFGTWVHVMTVLSERQAQKAVKLYESGVLDWIP